MHSMRKTYITRLMLAGVPLPTIKKLAGHRDIQTTMRHYMWVGNNDLRDGVERLSRRVVG